MDEFESVTLLGWEFDLEELDSLPDGFRDYLERYNDALEAFVGIASRVGGLSDGEPVDTADIAAKLWSAMEEYIVVDDGAQFADSTEVA